MPSARFDLYHRLSWLPLSSAVCSLSPTQPSFGFSKSECSSGIFLHALKLPQRMDLICVPLWNPHSPGLVVLEAPQPPCELRPSCAFHSYGSLQSWRSHRFLRQCDRPSGVTHHNRRIPWLDTLHSTEQGKLVGLHFRGS